MSLARTRLVIRLPHSRNAMPFEVKDKIFGENAARIFGINIAAARQAVGGDLLSN